MHAGVGCEYQELLTKKYLYEKVNTSAMDPDSGSSVTLIYYRIGEKWWKEPFLNVVAAAAQMSTLTHVEIALGGNSRLSNHSSHAHTRTHRRARAAQRKSAPMA